MLVDAWLPRAAAVGPHTLAVNNLSYGQLLLAAQRAARQLSALGVAAGDRVALVLEPGEDFVVAFHAVLLLGAVAVPIDVNASPSQLEARTAGARTVVDGPLEGHEDPAAILSTQHPLGAPAVVIFSSGSSGDGNEIELSYGNFWWSAAGSAVALGRSEHERWLCCLPVAHIGGLSIIVRSAIYATTAVVHQRFDLEAVLAELERSDGPSLISLVPTTLQRLLDAGLKAPPSLRWALLGGGPISPELLEQANEASVPVASSYGMTEACSQIVTRGAPLFCTTVELADSGEVLVSGPTVAAQCLPQLHTGDLARWTDAAELQLIGRASNIIISGGENVVPEVVEAAIATHPAVGDVAVVGRADPEWGEIVTALVVLRPGEKVDVEELIEHCKPLLAPHERPKRIDLVESISRSETGKLRRREL